MFGRREGRVVHFPIRKLDGESGGGGRIKEREEATVSRYQGMNQSSGRGADDSPIDRHDTKGSLIAARRILQIDPHGEMCEIVHLNMRVLVGRGVERKRAFSPGRRERETLKP